MRLFIDCDDTLKLQDYTKSNGGVWWAPKVRYINEPLVSAVYDFINAYDNTVIVVWSFNGEGHATNVAEECFGEERNWTVTKKDYNTPTADDIVIDDKPEDWRTYTPAKVYTPEEFIEAHG